MKPPRFEYLAPRTRPEALALLAEREDVKVIAGGQSLVPLLNFRLARPAALLDINGIAGLDGIAYDAATREIVLGSLVRQTDAERSPVVARHCPLLVEALRHVGHRTIRNRGTVGGSIAHADPSAELPLVLVTLDGRVTAASTRGERSIRAGELFVSYLMTSLAADELLVETRIPALPEGSGWAFEEFARRAGDFALAAVCATVLVRDGRVAACAIGIAGGGPVPMRAADAERALVGAVLDEAAIRDAADRCARAAEVESDIHASAQHRRELIGTLARRVLGRAAGIP